jgi:hypothetical protein
MSLVALQGETRQKRDCYLPLKNTTDHAKQLYLKIKCFQLFIIVTGNKAELYLKAKT